MSTLTAFDFIQERSEASPGLFNRVFSQLSDNIRTAANESGTFTSSSGNTLSLSSNLSIGRDLWVRGNVLVGQPASVVTRTALTLGVSSAVSDYIHFTDTSGAKSSYIIGSRVGGTADGLNLWDQSGDTMIASFSKQSIRFYQNVVGPVFDVGGALADTYNSVTFIGSGSSLSGLQAAINQASVDGVSRVYLPATMYPYSASSISFIHTVQLVREGGDWSVYDILAYGAHNDGSQSATSAVQAAINGASDGGIVYISAGTFLVSGLSSYGFASFQGSGRVGKLHNTTSGSTTLTVTRHPSLTTYRNREGNLDGIMLRDLYFSSNRITDVQGLWISRVDHSVFGNLSFEAINGPAIHIAGTVRECQFHNIVTRWCGASADTGAILIDDADSVSVEGTNALQWYGTNIIYSHGPSLQVRTSASSYSNMENKTRKLEFIGYQFHGSIRNGPNFDSPAPQPDSALTHSLVTLGSCRDIYFLAGNVTAAGQAAAFFSLQPGTSGVTASGCTNVTIRDTIFGGHTAPSAGTVATFNSGISVDRFCQVYVENCMITNSTRDLVVRSGGSVHLGLNVILNGTSSVSSTAYEPANRLTGVFAPRPEESLFILGATRLQTQTLREDTGSNPLRIDGGQDNATDSVIIRTPDSGGSQSLVDRIYFGSGSAVTVHIRSRTSIDGLLRTSGNITGGQIEALLNGIRIPGGTVQIPAIRFSSEDSLGFFRSGASRVGISFGQFTIPDGSGTTPSLGLSSATSIGFYSSGVRTIAQSTGTFNLATNAVRLSMRTLAASSVTASAANTNVAVNEVVFTIGGASGASLIISSGGTAYIFNSAASAILA